MRGQVYNVLRGFVWDVFWVPHREMGEEIARKRERESLGTEWPWRERECAEGCVAV